MSIITDLRDAITEFNSSIDFVLAIITIVFVIFSITATNLKINAELNLCYQEKKIVCFLQCTPVLCHRYLTSHSAYKKLGLWEYQIVCFTYVCHFCLNNTFKIMSLECSERYIYYNRLSKFKLFKWLLTWNIARKKTKTFVYLIISLKYFK